jgi:3-dehydroquinate synthase
MEAFHTQKSFNIKSKTEDYNVEFKIFTFNSAGDTISIVDETLLSLYPAIKGNIISIKANEESKNLINIPFVLEKLKQMKAGKQTKIIAIGGGVVQDISCFVANIYMRGLEWHFIPTTLLSLVDSCIGGKSSINVGEIKNLAGTFYPPKSIIIDTRFLKTLPKLDKISGLFEFIKICFASFDSSIFEEAVMLLEDYENNFEKIIFLSLKTKKWFIEIDEFDLKERQLLNFGHTFGHAIESVSDYKIIHGIAIGFGMLLELEFGEQENARVLKLKQIIQKLLSEVPENLKIIKSLDAAKIFNVFTSDKKHSKEFYNLIVANKDGFLIKKGFNKNEDFRNNLIKYYAKI